MSDGFSSEFIWGTQMVLFSSAPLIVAALGELIVERSGIVNIGIEGMMLAGALGAWIANGMFGIAAGLTASIVAAEILALIFAGAVLLYRADQIVTGTGINLLALGLTGLIYSNAPADAVIHGIRPEALISFAPILAIGVWFYLQRTRGGLELSAIGESPAAADTAGVPVTRRKFYALLFGAACAGLAGGYHSTMRVRGFTENMTEGEGFLALAIVIFGRWNTWGIVAAGLFFGILRALPDRLILSGHMSVVWTGVVRMMPYLVSLFALAGVGGRSAAPASLGKPYSRA